MLHHSTQTALLALQVVQGDVFNDPGCVADPAADVWSLGAIACEMLQGEQLHTTPMLQLARLCAPCCPHPVTAAGPKQLRPWQQLLPKRMPVCFCLCIGPVARAAACLPVRFFLMWQSQHAPGHLKCCSS